MDNLLQDINRNATNKDAYQQKIMSKAMENYGDADVQLALRSWHAGVPGAFDKVEEYTFRAEQEKAKHQLWQRTSEENKGDLSADADLAKSQYQQRAASTVFRNFNPVIDIPGLTSPQMQQKLLDDHRAGLPSSIKPEQWDQMLTNAQRARDVAANELKDIANNGGYSKRIRDPAAEKAIADNELQYFDRQIAAISSKDVGPMFENQRRAKSLQDNAQYQLLSDPNIGSWLLNQKVLQDQAGPALSSWITQQTLAKGYLGRFQNYFGDVTAKSTVPDDIRKDGTVKSMYSDIVKAREAARTNKVPPRLYDDLVDNVNLITKAHELGNENVAKEVAKYTFDPAKNGNLMKLFGRDFTDDNGVFHKGQFAYYDVLSKPKVVDSVWKLKDSETWNMMKDWQEGSFKTLFGEEVQNLNKIQGDKSLPMKLNFDSDHHQFIPEFPKATTAVEANYIRYAQDSITKLNKGLQNLSYMHDKMGGDTNEYLFNMLTTMGYSPNDRVHGDNLPQRAVQAIAASTKSNKNRIDEAFKAAQ
jgi:hypothetical protein